MAWTKPWDLTAPAPGMPRAPWVTVAGVKHYRDLIAWQLADGFKHQVFTLLQPGSRAEGNRRYRDQLIGSASAVSKDIAEGFLRYSPATFAHLLDCAVASLAEAEDRLEDGVLLGYFRAEHVHPALRLGRRAAVAIVRLKQSQVRYIEISKHQGAEQAGKRQRRNANENDDKDQVPRP